MKIFIWMLLLYSVPFIFLMMTLLDAKTKKYYTLGKTLASVGFIIVAIVSGMIGNHQIDVWSTMPVCLGMFYLESIIRTRKKNSFWLDYACFFVVTLVSFYPLPAWEA